MDDRRWTIDDGPYGPEDLMGPMDEDDGL